MIALQGAAGFVVQARLAAFARARSAEGFRVAGVAEEFGGARDAGCAGRALRDLPTGRRHAIGQDLGPGSLACQLDASGVAAACRGVFDAIEDGCDLVVLAKFGKLEAERSGLVDAFAAAVARDLPVITSVAPAFSAAWERYSAPLARFVEPKSATLESWWRSIPEGRLAPRALQFAG
ncbi:DUF2478 domain-containing protein [Methylopila sp. M107]|uniref:DUF2478 domain-containing protein n=1 Tax=Methylopila sp. M107 TaxID=1101190 RepID=UPI0003A341A0|nr:DUF2478 domain-containing protein [Methylopila sp. M107]